MKLEEAKAIIHAETPPPLPRLYEAAVFVISSRTNNNSDLLRAYALLDTIERLPVERWS